MKDESERTEAIMERATVGRDLLRGGVFAGLASLAVMVSAVGAQPTEAETRDAVATLVAQRHDGENGWPLLEEAIEASAAAHAEAEAAWATQQRPRDPESLDDQIHLILKGDWPRDGLAGAELLVASHGAHSALDKLHALAELGQAWPPVDEFPAAPRAAGTWYAPLRKLCRVRRAAMRMEAAEGDLQGAVEGARELLVAGRICADQLSLQHRMHGVAFAIFALEEIRHQVVEGLYDPATCREMIGVIDEGLAWPSLEVALEAERRLTVDSFARIRNEPEAAAPLEQALRKAHAAALRDGEPDAGMTGAPSLDGAIERARFELDLAMKSDRFVRTVADATRIMLALEVYRAEQGQYPADLEALAPGYLPAIPEDRIAGQPLRYKPLKEDEAGRGYLLYSVGLDGQDDAGTVHEYGPSVAAIGKARPGFDFVFNHPRDPAPR